MMNNALLALQLGQRHCSSSLKLVTWVHNKGKKKKNNKAQKGSTKGKINFKVGYLAYVAYNNEGLNHVHACMCQYDLKKNQGKFQRNKSMEEYLT